MFASIQWWTSRSIKDRQPLQNAVIECNRAFVRPVKDNPDQVELSLEHTTGCENFVVDKPTTDVFLMNNEGRTIDAYRWSESYLEKS